MGPSVSPWYERWAGIWREEPYLAAALLAALVAMASTPIAFAILTRQSFFQARRGRTTQPPSFSSVVVGMMLVMGIPAIFGGMLVKSRYYDKYRYEYDPNQHVLGSPEELKELKLLEGERAALVNSVKDLDQELLKIRAIGQQSQPVAAAVNPFLQKLAVVRKAVGLDAPLQLLPETGLPAELPGLPAFAVASPVGAGAPAAAPAAAPKPGVPPALVEAEIGAVPEAQKRLAAMLPLSDIAPGWEVGEMAGKHLETFTADNLFEKINGRAESFLQFGVKGMAYTNYHPAGDESSELQLYIFEMGSDLKALGKYGTEKPAEGIAAIEVGDEGYQSAGSTFFYRGPYYTQIVSSVEDPKLAAFALALAQRIDAIQSGKAAPAPVAATPEPTAPMPAAAEAPKAEPAAPKPAPTGPAAIFALLPKDPNKDRPQFVVSDVFGYSFLTNVFLAEYKEGEVGFQGFLRPCASPEAAKALLEKYAESVKADGAEVKPLEGKEADSLLLSANIGLFDVVFVKNNVFGGVNGATEAGPAESFARKLAAGLSGDLPIFEEKAEEAVPPAGSH
jgi:hypothetical protein